MDKFDIVKYNVRSFIDIDEVQEPPDIVADMYKVFTHWLDETIDHPKRDNLVWEHLVNLGYFPITRKKNGDELHRDYTVGSAT